MCSGAFPAFVAMPGPLVDNYLKLRVHVAPLGVEVNARESQDSRRPRAEEKEEEQAQALRRTVVGHRPVVILEHMGFIPELAVQQKY